MLFPPPPNSRNEIDMQQINVQLKDAKLNQRIHKCVPTCVPSCKHGSGRCDSCNILLRNVVMSGDGGNPCSTRRFDGVRIVIVAGAGS